MSNLFVFRLIHLHFVVELKNYDKRLEIYKNLKNPLMHLFYSDHATNYIRNTRTGNKLLNEKFESFKLYRLFYIS